MGINFEPEMRENDVITYSVKCESTTLGSYSTYTEAVGVSDRHELECEFCIGMGAEITSIGGPPSVHVSNANAHHLLGLLGFNNSTTECPSLGMCDEMSGSCSAEDFLGRVLIAQGLCGHDAGKAAYEIPKNSSERPYWMGGATIIDCGRREGYSDERLEQLAEIARWAQSEGRDVQWC